MKKCKYKDKKCEVCGKQFKITGGRQLSCLSCKQILTRKKEVEYRRRKREEDKEWLKRRREMSVRSHDRMIEKYPLKFRARYRVRDYVRRGKMAKLACEVCGNFLSEAHHPDYGKLVDVWWLCRKHHRLADKGELVLYNNT